MIRCNNGKCSLVRMGNTDHSHEKILKSHSNSTKQEIYDDIIIELTKDRIEQIANNIRTAETKSGLVIGFATTIIGIILNMSSYQTILFNSDHVIWQTLVTWLPLIFLTTSIGLCVPILLVRTRFRFIAPRATNNDHIDLSIIDFKKKLKEKLIENFEIMQSRRKHDRLLLNTAISFLISSSAIIFITLILQKNGIV